MTLTTTLEKRDSVRDQHKKHVLNLPLTSVLSKLLLCAGYIWDLD